MYDKIHNYRFLMQDGRQLIGKVIAQDDTKLVIDAGRDRAPERRTILYHHAIIRAERMGWKWAPVA
ncbi:hypothetical protein EG831_02385 [bacterium]|nr:hypothetical protein [bacterium]